MRKKKLGGITALAFAVTLCVAQGTTVRAEYTEADTTLPAADSSRGIEYYYESGSTTVSGIILNGNSVIIRESENSTDRDNLINIYNDKNHNGVIDDGENAFEIDGSADIKNCPVYGLYKQKGTEPIVITAEDVGINYIWGVYQGSLEVTGDVDAVTINIKNVPAYGYVTNAYESKVTGGLKLDVTGSSYVGTAQASAESEISGDIKVNITDTAKLSMLYGVKSTYSTGNVDIKTGSQSDVRNVYGVYESSIDGDLTVNAKHKNQQYAYFAAVSDGKYKGKDYSVKGSVNCNIEGAEISSIYGLNSGMVVGGDMTLTVKDTKTNGIYGIYSAQVGGNAKTVYNGITGLGSSTTNIYGASSSSIAGSATVDMKNIACDNAYIYGLSSTSVGGDVDMDIEAKESSITYLYGILDGKVKGSTNVDIENCKVSSSFYGIYGTTFEQTNPSDEDAYANVVTYKNIETNSYYYGVSSVKNLGSTHATMDGIKVSGTMYGVDYSSVLNGRLKLDMSNCRGNSYGYAVKTGSSDSVLQGQLDVNVSDCAFGYDFYAVYNGTVVEDANIDIKNVISSRLYGAYYSKLLKKMNATIAHANSDTILDADGNPLKDSYSSAGSGDFNLTYSTLVAGDMTADISDVHYAGCGLAGGSSGSQRAGKNTKVKLRDSSFAGTYSSNMVYLLNEYDSSSTENPEATTADITISNCDFTGIAGVSFLVSATENRTAKISFDEACKLPDDYYMCPGYGNRGAVTLTYGGDIYYGGNKVIIDKDITADNVYLGNYNNYKPSSGLYAMIKSGVTVTAQEAVYIASGAYVLNCGSIVGKQKHIDGSEYSGALYMKGGSVSDEEVHDIVKVYYPIKLVYNDKAVTANFNTVSCPMDTVGQYACSGDTLSITPVVKRGYILDKVIYKGAGETLNNEAELKDGVYSFAMPKEACTVEVVTRGKQIRASKTKSDPSAVLGKKYTEEEPLYDMSDIVIMNDAAEGEVSYEVDENNALPEGLVLTGSFITGTPTTAHEDGKRVVINITGKNGTKASVTLNVIVSKEQKIQDNTDGRITIDDENKKISLNGTSVVIQAAVPTDTATEDGETGDTDQSVITEIYLDSNRDGAADGRTPLCSGDLSEYEIVGVDDSVFNRCIKVTMLGGKVSSIIGAVDSEISYEGDDAVAVDIQGGYVDTVYALANTKVNGTIYYGATRESVGTGGKKKDTTSTYTGSYVRNSKTVEEVIDYVVTSKKVDAVTIDGTYSTKRDITATSLIIYDKAAVTLEGQIELSGTMSLYENTSTEISGAVKANAMSFSRNANAVVNGNVNINRLNMTTYKACLTIGENSLFETGEVNNSGTWESVYQKGTFKCPSDKFSNDGIWVVAGKFADGVDVSGWDSLYYKLGECTTNLKGTSVTVGTQQGVTVYEGATYVKNKYIIDAKYTDVPGYTVYVTSDENEPVRGENGKAKVSTANGSLTLTADYVADEITVSKKYADPVIVADVSYTAESPAYDLTALDVAGDTTSSYGTDIQYRVKNGSKLPAGLTLTDGRVTGKTSQAGESDVTFVVTGRNGTSADVNVKFTVKAAGTELTDINKLITDATTSKIDLAGCSVVIIEDPKDSLKVSIYMDADHDGIADNNRALKIDGETSYNLGSCKIYGYTDADNAHSGDISVILRSGTVGALYGAGSTDSNAARVTVNGSVTVRILGGTVITEAYGACNSDVTEVNFIAEGGKLYKKAYGAYNTNVQTMNFAFTKSAMMYADTNYQSTGKEELYVTNGGSVSGDVNIDVGVKNSEPFAYGRQLYGSTYAFFYGVYKTPVAGNVNCTVDGNWYIGRINTFVNDSDVDGDLNVELKSGDIGSSATNDHQRAFVLGNARNKINNINVRSATEGTVTGKIVAAAGVEVNNIYFNDVSGNTSATVSVLASNFQVTLNGSLFAKTKDGLELGGTYTIAEDVDTKKITVNSGSKITVADGVTVRHTSDATIEGDIENNGTWTSAGNITIKGAFVNRGAWNTSQYIYLGDSSSSSVSGRVDNYGTVTTASSRSYTTRIYAGSMFINREAASFEFGYMINNGAIVNYGALTETYYNNSANVGTVFTTTIPAFKYLLKNYSNMYYKVDAEYPSYCFKDGDAKVSIAATNSNYQKTSGVDGDTNVYIAGNMDFYVTVDGEPIDGMVIDSVVYGSDQNKATSSDNVKWRGTVAYEPTHAVINMAKEEATQITLAKTEDEVAAQVGVSTTAGSPLYDLTAIEIQGDQAVENGYVAYSLVKGQTLPAGLTFKNGRIYGTPVNASDDIQTVKFNVRGQNQTIAEFTLNITRIEKGVPALAKADMIQAYAGKTLADVTLPKAANGTYIWADSTQKVGAAGTTEQYDAYFVPNDTANYDWSRLDEASGTYEQLEDGSVRIAVKLSVYVRKQDPVYELPVGVTVIYGETIGEAVIPEIDNGKFIWENPDESVGEVGTKTFLATFVPADEGTYERAEHIEITVEVKPAAAKFTQAVDKLTAKENDTLADIELPETEDGIYTWYTDRSIQVVDGEYYKLCFKPADTTNYDWTGVEGWNRAYRGVVFSVQIEIEKEHVHDYGDAYKRDSTYHWKKCECGDVQNKQRHAFGKGTIEKKATDTATGIKEFKCTVCGYTKTEKIPALGKNIADARYKIKVTGYSDQKYTGKAITFKNLKVYSGSTQLVVNKDYTVKYADNKKHGKASITISGIGKYRGTITKNFQIKLVKGSVYTLKQAKTGIYYKYRITNASLNGKCTVTLIGTKKSKTDKKFTAITISDTINIDGVTFRVTAIGGKAFKDYKYVKTVSGGKYVTAIGTYAFSGCKKLATFKVTSTKLKTVSKNAFKGTKSKITFKIPRKYYKSYKNKIMAKSVAAPKNAIYKKY